MVMGGQFLFYFIIVLIVDYYRSGVYKRSEGGDHTEATSYAKLAVYNDALDHAEKVKQSQNYPNHKYYIKAE